jgi:hypothetical protein
MNEIVFEKKSEFIKFVTVFFVTRLIGAVALFALAFSPVFFR